MAVHVGNTPEKVLLNLAVHLLGGRLVYVPPEPGAAELKDVIVTGRTSDNVCSRLLDDFLITLPVSGRHGSVVDELDELHRPRGVTIVPQLPLTKVGKVDKRKLRSQFR